MTLFLLLASCFTPEEQLVQPPPAEPATPAAAAEPKTLMVGRRLDNNHKVALQDDGSLVELTDPAKKTLQPLGTVASDGTYQLLDGRRGNLFHSSDLALSVPLSGMFSSRVESFAKTSSEIPTIRNQVAATGQGIKVGVLDANTRADRHEDQMVPAVIRDVAPNAAYLRLQYNAPTPTSNLSQNSPGNTMPEFNDFVVGMTLNYFDQFMGQLQALLADPNAPRIVNVSNGFSFAKFTNTLFRGVPREHPVRLQLSEDSHQMTLDANRMVESILTSDPRFQKKLTDYQTLTKKIAEKGTTLVVACGNDSESDPSAPGTAFNILAMSPHVISVASSNSQETPGNFTDDTISQSSALGNQKWNPTLAAPGAYIRVPNASGGIDIVSGTSFSAPYVAGAIALMLETNANLTFAQIKDLLIRSSVSLEGIDGNAAGAGVLNVPLAVSLVTQP